MSITRYQIRALRHVIGGTDPRETVRPPYTQKNLASALGVSASTVREWEAGHKEPMKLEHRSRLNTKIKAHIVAVARFAGILEAQDLGEAPKPPQWARKTPRPRARSSAERHRRASLALSKAAEEFIRTAWLPGEGVKVEPQMLALAQSVTAQYKPSATTKATGPLGPIATKPPKPK